MEENDLLENYTELPDEVTNILGDFFDKENTYENCEQLVKELNSVGYTIDYGLDAEPHDLRKL